ncbi:MAG: FCD domain-containing protein, partial [Steroidobacteraceae bacterium]
SAALTLHGARFADVWEALLAVEPAIAAAAARRATPGQRAELRALAAAFSGRDMADPDRVATVGSFFRLLGACTSNPVFVVAHEPLVRLLEPGLARIIDILPQAPRRIAAAQAALCAALEAGNPDEAASWMRRHIEDFRRGFEQAGLSPDTVVGGAP